ncbi:MAG: hypothetical protein C0591_13030 [Marinilabiliales bacterium]|nr:MAG: hypothetical protein C0591_13030 [Marinilabiliales bacterium]
MRSSAKKTLKLISGFILVLGIIHGCIDEYWPEIDDYEDILVIDGSITNQPGPYEISLSYSSSISRPEEKPFIGAQVIIRDDLGYEEIYTEISPGVHQSAVNGLQGTIGRKYKIIIRTPDEKEYQSSFQELKNPVEIADVYAEIESRETTDEYRTEYGYQFYVDSKVADEDSTYLMWRAVGTYKYQSDFLIRYVYDRRVISVFPQPDSFYTCYNNDINTGIFTADLSKLSTPEALRIPLNYVNTDTRKLSIRYSLDVKQLTMTFDAFTYYKSLSDINSQQDALYTQQPYQVKGNVKNVLNADDALLGFFLVAGADEKRIYVDRPPSSQVKFYYGICYIDDGDFDAYKYIRTTPSNTWPLYVTTDDVGHRALTDQACVDCRRRGGTIEKPDFWVD